MGPDPNFSNGEMNGIPIGMQFPVGGGLPGCTYGSGSCGGGIGMGFQDPLPPRVWDPNFWIRVTVIGLAIYESAKLATSQAAHNVYNAVKSYVNQLHTQSQSSG